MQFEITDDAAITFGHVLYEAIADGYPLDAATTEARKAIYADGNLTEWGTPVLYLRAPDGHIFDIQDRPPPVLPPPLRSKPKKSRSGPDKKPRNAPAGTLPGRRSRPKSKPAKRPQGTRPTRSRGAHPTRSQARAQQEAADNKPDKKPRSKPGKRRSSSQLLCRAGLWRRPGCAARAREAGWICGGTRP